MAINRFRQAVEEHTSRNGRDSHMHEYPGEPRHEISYALYDCDYCEEENIVATKALFDTWQEVWPPVEAHLKREHPTKLTPEQTP